MALVSFLFVAILVLLVMSWEDRKIKEIKQRRIAKKKLAKLQKSSKIAGPSSSGMGSNGLIESRDDQMWLSERERERDSLSIRWQ